MTANESQRGMIAAKLAVLGIQMTEQPRAGGEKEPPAITAQIEVIGIPMTDQRPIFALWFIEANGPLMLFVAENVLSCMQRDLLRRAAHGGQARSPFKVDGRRAQGGSNPH